MHPRRRLRARAVHNARAMNGVRWWPTILASALLGCAGAPPIDTRYSAQGQDSRVQFVILHYTGAGFAESLQVLTQERVSAHYLVSDESPPRVYRLVDEGRRAWHAGDSHWQDHAMLNAASIGIEIVHPGGMAQPDGTMHFPPYPQAQVDALIALLRDIVARHRVPPERILGHSDVAPQRKIDPGASFPWDRLAAAGLVPWPDPQRVAERRRLHEALLPEVWWFQHALAVQGYRVPDSGVLDEPTRRVLAAFQMKYRPALHDGEPDAETAALLDVLNGADR
jgi:N-acetylmuramoyl-L-alanine amidase